MSGTLPLRPEVDYTPDGRSYIDIDGENASSVLPTLASTTARQILIQLHEKPRTASDLADSVDTSLQNVLHHLSSLQEAGLITIVGTWYSSRGVEMDVYAPVAQSLILFAGSKNDFDAFKQVTQESTGNSNSKVGKSE